MNSHLDRSWRVGAMFAAGLTSLALSSASSGQPLQCEFEQVTHTTEGFSATPSIDASGTRIAFSSRRNVTPGPATVHVYLIDTAAATETQVSLVSRSFRPSISGDGNRIGFGLPTPSPIGGQWDVYLYDKPSSTTQQLTDTPNAPNANDQHQLNGDGTRVVLRSSADLTGDSLPIWGTQLFLWDEASGFSQLTDVGGVGVNDIAIDGSGTLLAFSSHADLDPLADNSEGSREVFLYHTATGTFTQVTDTPAGTLSQYIDLSADGSHLAFVSTADLLAGQNADHSREVFLYDVAAKSFRQITDDPEINSGPRLNADGSKLVFYTEYADHYRMFVYDAATNAVNPVTPASAGFYSYDPAINADGTRIAFVSDDDLVGTNADHNEEIFLAKDCTAAVVDGDGDGVSDDVDACLGSDLGPTIKIGSCDSGVGNLLFADGCSRADLFADLVASCSAGARNHGAAVSCFAAGTHDLQAAGLIGAARGKLQSCAARGLKG